MYDNYIIANCPQSVPVKKCENLSIIGEDTNKSKVPLFLLAHDVGLDTALLE